MELGNRESKSGRNCPKCGVRAKMHERDPDVYEYQCPQCGDWLYEEAGQEQDLAV